MWRAALGGTLGWVFYLIYIVMRHPNPYNFLFVLYLPVYMVTGAVMGSLVGLAIWRLATVRRTWPGLLQRIVVGIFLSLATALLLDLVSAERQSNVASVPQISFIVDFFVGAIIIGAASGFLARPKSLDLRNVRHRKNLGSC